MERRIKGVLSPKASGSITITENGNYDVVDVANAIVNVVPEEVGGITPEGSITLTTNGVYDVTMYAEAVVDVENVIPEGYVKPSGTLNVTSNGTFDVTEKKNVSVNVPQPSGTIEITENGVVNVTNYANANVNVNVMDENGAISFECLQLVLNNHLRTSNLRPFYGSKIETLPQGLDFSSLKLCEYLFSDCSQLKSLPFDINSSNATSFSSMFSGCSKLVTIGNINTRNGTLFGSMFQHCGELQSDINLDTEKGTSLSGMFQNCKKIKKVKLTSTKNGTNYNNMFWGDYEIESIEGIDLLSATSVGTMFYSCGKLTNLKIKNIKLTLQIASGTSYGHLLTLESLLYIMQELIDTGSSKTLTIGTSNLPKLANVYVKVISEEPDENGNVKLPFEVCESTDEGAMLITNYVSLKNWSLA